MQQNLEKHFVLQYICQMLEKSSNFLKMMKIKKKIINIFSKNSQFGNFLKIFPKPGCVCFERVDNTVFKFIILFKKNF